MGNLTTCRVCLNIKPLSDFNKNSKSKTGLRGDCRTCQNASKKAYRQTNRDRLAADARAYYQANREKVLASQKAYYDANCDKISDYGKAYRQTNRDKVLASKKAYRQANPDKVLATRKAHSEANRDKINAKARAYFKANHDKVLAYQKVYSKANPEVAKNNNGKRRTRKLANGTFKVSAKELKRLLALPCSYCGDTSEHIDHIIPISRGGAHSIGNLTGACASCNFSKGRKFITEWKKGQKCR